MMLPHGPDREAFDHASNGELKPVKLTGTMAFMFETRFPQRITDACRELRDAAGRLRGLLEGTGKAVRSEQAVNLHPPLEGRARPGDRSISSGVG